MATFGYPSRYRPKGSFRGTKQYRKGSRFSAYKKWTGASRRPYRGSNRKMRSGSGKLVSRITALEKKQKHGDHGKLEFELGLPVSCYWGGRLHGNMYFDIPISAVMRRYLQTLGKSKMVITGVGLEMVVDCGQDIELQLCGVLRPLGMGVPDAQFVDTGNGSRLFYLVGQAEEGKQVLMTGDESRVQAMVQGVFARPAVDGTLFDAEMENLKDWPVKEWTVGRGRDKAVTSKHRQLTVPFKQQPHTDRLGGQMTRERVRLYCETSREVSASLIESDFVLFGGFRSMFTLSMNSGKDEGYIAGSIVNARLKIYYRA